MRGLADDHHTESTDEFTEPPTTPASAGEASLVHQGEFNGILAKLRLKATTTGMGGLRLYQVAFTVAPTRGLVVLAATKC